MRRPTIDPIVVGELTGAAPARLIRKLDKDPERAEAWDWSESEGRWTIATDGEAVVTLEPEGGAITGVGQVSCSCLLSPKCLHLLSVLTRLELADVGALPADVAGADDLPEIADLADADVSSSGASGAARAAGSSGRTGADGAIGAAGSSGRAGAGASAGSRGVGAGASAGSSWATGAGAFGATAEISDAQLEAAAAFRAVLVEQVDAGLGSCGIIGQGGLLRAVHGCRIAGLPRLASTGVRVVSAVRALQTRAATFSTARLARDVADALEITERIAASRALTSDVGVARQRYEPIGNLRAAGLCAEPVATSSGYAGVVTYLIAPDGRLLSVSDVRPGDGRRARESYRGGVGIGDASLSHRELVRAGLYLTRATASATGRLGRGKNVGAVAGPATAWSESPIADRFTTPIAKQVAAALAELELPVELRRAGCDLLFFEADIVEPVASPIRFALDGDRIIEGRVTSESRALRFRENLRVLGRARGRVRVIARLASAELHAVYPIAIAPLDDAIALPDALGGVVCVGLDRLAGASVALSGPAVDRPSGTAGVDGDTAGGDDRDSALGIDALHLDELSGAAAGDSETDPDIDDGTVAETDDHVGSRGNDETDADSQADDETDRPRDLVDPTASLRRRLHRLVLGGRTTLPASAGPEIDRERARFARSMLGTGARLLEALWLAARRGPESGGGLSATEAAEVLARAFARAHAYDRLLARHLIEIAWRD